MQNRKCIVFERTRDTDSTSHLHVWESRAYYVFNQSSNGYSFASKEIAFAFARWNFLLPAAKKKQRDKIDNAS